MASNNDLKLPVQMDRVTMETELSCDVRFIFLTLRLPQPFRWFENIELARNRVSLSPLVSHTKYTNLSNILKIYRQYKWYYSPVAIFSDLHSSYRGSNPSLTNIFLFFVIVVFCVFFFFTPTSTLRYKIT